MIVWNTEWVNDYESPWSIFEKLCYANHITQTDILRTLGSTEVQQIKNTVIGDNRRELVELSGFDHQKLHNYMGYDMAAQNSEDVKLIIKPNETYQSTHILIPKTIRWFIHHRELL